MLDRTISGTEDLIGEEPTDDSGPTLAEFALLAESLPAPPPSSQTVYHTLAGHQLSRRLLHKPTILWNRGVGGFLLFGVC